MLLLPNLWFAVDAEATSFEIATIQNFLFISWAASKFKDTDYYYPRSNKSQKGSSYDFQTNDSDH